MRISEHNTERLILEIPLKEVKEILALKQDRVDELTTTFQKYVRFIAYVKKMRTRDMFWNANARPST